MGTTMSSAGIPICDGSPTGNSKSVSPNVLNITSQSNSLNLSQSVFTDLVSTTEAYEALQNKEEALANELSRAQAQVFPLRKENTRLLRENNQLHMELIKAEDNIGKSQQVRATTATMTSSHT